MAAESPSTAYADRVLREAMAAATGGLDPSVAEEALTSATQAIARQMKALEDKDYAAMSPDQVARAVAHTTKAADVLFRLVEFARGKPDSRLDLGTDWLRALSDEQLRTVQRWVEERERKEGT
jgi:hypothetical protein